MSKHIFLSVLAALFATVCVQASQIVVVDSADGSPLSGAAVISNRGVIKGLTDDDGAIGSLSSDDYPVSVRLIGYRDSVFTAVSDTMALVVDDFRLPEVTVSTAARPVTRMLCYIREYSTGCTPKDTLQMYTEAMADVFLADKNVKGYKDGDAKPRLLASRHFTRQADSQGLDSVYVSDDEILVSFIDKQWSVPPLVLHEYDRIKAGERTDTIFGKYGPKNIMRKMPGLLTLKHDALADHKNRVMSPWLFKMLGLTVDFVQVERTLAYIPNDAGVYDMDDFISSGFTIRYLGKGKWFKKIFKVSEPVEFNLVVELYPVDVTHLTIEEYKELRKEKPDEKFVRPDIAPALHPAVQSIVDRLPQ